MHLSPTSKLGYLSFKWVERPGPTVIKLEKILNDFDMQFPNISKKIFKFIKSVYDNCEVS